jgi:ABC-type oligopeptide transport system substrate-binding subunit
VVEPELSDAEEGSEPTWLEPVAPVARPSRARRMAGGVLVVVLAIALIVTSVRLFGVPAASQIVAAATDKTTVSILVGAPASLDPAHHGDLTSASYVSQLYETLTAVDPALAIRPALAESWTIGDGARQVTFHLRPNLEFSDGSPLKASDVVHSWRRLFDPKDPSPLASLFAEVVGARDLLSGKSTDTSTLGVSAPDDRTVVVNLERGGNDIPGIVSSAPFAVVPPSAGDAEISPTPGDLVGSGGYTLQRVDPDSMTLQANPHYWAGKPAIETVKMVTTLNGNSPVEAFESGNLDVAPIGWFDASWIAYNQALGPALRSDPSLSVIYYGFETRRPPFDKVEVRRAFAAAVDWRRLAALDEPGSTVAATGMVPKGIPGAPAGDFIPKYDPAGAKQLLASAGYADGKSLGPISFVSSGGQYDGGIVTMLEQNLGVDIQYSTMDFQTYQDRLVTDPPQIWSIDWVADYPGPNDFLGVLLGTGSTSNQGGWSSAPFDQAIEDATSASTPDDATAAYARALGIVRDDAPVVPVTYGTSYSLVREGLLGATSTGTGILRLAGLAWQP